MKKLFYTLVLCVAISCSKDTTKTNSITYLVDITNPKSALPKTAVFRQYINPYLANADNGLEVGLVYITDVHRNKKHTVVLPSRQSNFLSSDLERKFQTNNFDKELDSLFLDVRNKRQGYEQSHIFRAINRELTRLSKQTNKGVKRLIVISDLEQSNHIFSVYDKNDITALAYPERVANYIETTMDIPHNLHGVELLILHTQHKDTEILFDKMLEVYKHLYQSRGLKITANQHTKTYIP